MAGFKEIIKHTGNYLVANLATRALAFISIPIYTRLLSPADYGVLSVFLGVVGIIGSVLTLCTDQSISRYFFDQKNEDDFRRFTGTSSILAVGIFFINAFLLFIFAKDFGKLVGLQKNLVYLMIPFSFFNAISLTFEQIYGPLKRSKGIALASLSRAYISFAFSVGAILILKTDKYYGPVIGQILGGAVLAVYWIKCIAPYFKFSFDKSYVKYIVSYSVPLVPYVLSGVIIDQFGKIAIGTRSASQAGFYSLALTIANIVSIVIAVTLQAWNPYYFEYMNTKNYEKHDQDQDKIFRITLFVAIGVAALGNEIGILLASKAYSTSLYLVPVFVIGYVFYQLSYVYMRNFGFTRKTQYLTFTVLLSGISNVVFNTILIPWKGELGAAFSLVLSYILMAVLAWIFNKYFVKFYTSPLRIFLIPLLITSPFFLATYFVFLIKLFIVKIIIKVLLILLSGLILFWDFKEDILKYLKQSKKISNAAN